MPIREDAYFADSSTPSRVAGTWFSSPAEVAGTLSQAASPDILFAPRNTGTEPIPVSPGKGKLLAPMTFFVDSGNDFLENIVTTGSTPNQTPSLLQNIIQRKREILASRSLPLGDRLSKAKPNDITSAEVTLLVNPQDLNLNLQKLFDEQYTRGGWSVAHTATPHPTIRVQGKTAGFYCLTRDGKIGITRDFRNSSTAYNNLMDLLALYKNNGREWDPDQNVANTGRNARRVLDIVISYDDWIFIGSFRTFEIEDDATHPYYLIFSFQFEVRAFYHLTWAGDATSDNRRNNESDNKAVTPDTLLEVARSNRLNTVVTRVDRVAGVNATETDIANDRLNTIIEQRGPTVKQAAVAERDRIRRIYYNDGPQAAEDASRAFNQKLQKQGVNAALGLD